MSARLVFDDPGLFVSVQDAGRRGFRSIGVPLAGALDPVWLAGANALLGNAPDAPALEIRFSGPTLRLIEGGPVRFALNGRVEGAVIARDGARRPVPAQQSVTLFVGESLSVGRCEGTAYLAVSGGFGARRDLGSASTLERASLGGIKGRAPQKGDEITCAALANPEEEERRAAAPPPHETGPFRFMPGPQQDHFEPAALAALTRETYTVSPALDRMGMRLDGPALKHNALGADIVSDGVTPGVIQCPANGQPIILLADGQTMGGYAKPGCIIRADLPRLAHLRPADTLSFVAVTREEAGAARLAARQRFAAWCASIERFRPAAPLSAEALLATNLISGATFGED